MKFSNPLILAALGLYAFTLVRADQGGMDPAADDGGLKSVKVAGLDQVYARPGIDLSVYDKVMLDPVEVSFTKSAKPDRNGGPITAAEKRKIGSGLSGLFREELRRELARSHRYALVDHVNPDMLRVRAEIRDLYINAPAVPSSGASRPYAVSVGEIRLVAELRDASSGALLARVVDSTKDPSAPWLHFRSRADVAAAARAAVDGWARILERELDLAHAQKG